MKKYFTFFVSLLVAHHIIAQSVGIGNWQEHLSYTNGVSVSEGNGKVYCATKSGVFAFNKSDNSMERLSKVNGLSDVEPAVVNFNSFNNKLLIAYKNSNVDIIDNTLITNVGDIKRKSIVGNKTINNIYFREQYAYLACGFGVVVVDMNKYEIKDTYYIGISGNQLNISDVTSDDTYLYAASDSGIYRAALNSPNLANYASWTAMSGLPKGTYNSITSFNGKIVANFSKFLKDGSTGKDTLFVYNSTSWNKLNGSGYTVNSIKKCNANLVITFEGAVSLYDQNMVLSNTYTSYLGNPSKAKQAVLDNSGNLWIADFQNGLVSLKSGGSFEFNYPNGPNSANVNAMCVLENDLWVAPGGGGSGGGFGSYYNDGIYTYSGTEWKHIFGNHKPIVNFDSIADIMNVLIDPNNTQKAYATWGSGLIEFDNGLPSKLYNESNSTLKGINYSPTYNPIWVNGMAVDASDNLWVVNSLTPKCLSKKASDGTWQAVDLSAILGLKPSLTQMLIDKSGQKWVILYREGLVVYKGTGEAGTTSNTKKMTTAAGEGALPSLQVLCLAEEKEGQIWIGTDKGIAVFNSPSSIFSGQNYDAQQIFVEQDGNIQILLETETIQSIAVDGANRKWISTLNSGVFLMSADGTKQIYHFDENNSPLLSNNVKSIVINPTTGDVFFGTSKGIISFRGTATEALDNFTDVYSFPNPVKPGYEGPIAIKGLTFNSTVKITDISGTLLYETKSEGGQAIWNGKNFTGEKVSTGVYMVFCTSEDGSQKLATKILFVN